MKATSHYETARIPAMVSGGATRAARGQDEGDTPLRDGKDDDVDERRRNEGGMRAAPERDPVKKTARMMVLALVSGGATRAARKATTHYETTKMMIPALVSNEGSTRAR
jgi:hypothetical protein